MQSHNPSQFSMPLITEQLAIDPLLIAKQPSMTKALVLCQTLSGKPDDHFYGEKGIVKAQAQWSRVMGASDHNFPHDKLNLFMDLAGNEAPLMWLLHSRGYDLHSVRLRETETEKKLRLAQEENAALRRVLIGEKA